MALSNDGVRWIEPFGGSLIDPMESGEGWASLLRRAGDGGLSPLDRFMGAASYRRVVEGMRLVDGKEVPVSVTLPVEPGSAIGLTCRGAPIPPEGSES